MIMSYQVYGQQPSKPVRSDVGINTIPVGYYPTGVAIDPNTEKVYVTNSGLSYTVLVIDGKTDKYLTSIQG
jgi:DNA-binding beta-propeller fold protein YncE